jgi:hypothetical protein
MFTECKGAGTEGTLKTLQEAGKNPESLRMCFREKDFLDTRPLLKQGSHFILSIFLNFTPLFFHHFS